LGQFLRLCHYAKFAENRSKVALIGFEVTSNPNVSRRRQSNGNYACPKAVPNEEKKHAPNARARIPANLGRD
jgi:hypothetical protein